MTKFEQEPVAWDAHGAFDGMRVPEKSDLSGGWADTTPPQRTWVGLTDEERGHVYASWRFNGSNSSNLELCRAIEAKLKEKNT